MTDVKKPSKGAKITDQSDKVPLIVADWRTGAYTQRSLAGKYKVSVGFVNKHTKSVDCDTKHTVNKLVEAKQELSLFGEQAVNAVHEVVDERTKHIKFFTDAAILNVKESLLIPCESQNDFKARADTILKGKEAVLGKTPDTAIQINNTSTSNNLTIDQFRETARTLLNEI